MGLTVDGLSYKDDTIVGFREDSLFDITSVRVYIDDFEVYGFAYPVKYTSQDALHTLHLQATGAGVEALDMFLSQKGDHQVFTLKVKYNGITWLSIPVLFANTGLSKISAESVPEMLFNFMRTVK